MGKSCEWTEWRNARQGIVRWFRVVDSKEIAVDEVPVDVHWRPAPLSAWLDTYAYGLQGDHVVFGTRADVVPDKKVYLAAEFNDWLSSGLDTRWELNPHDIDGTLFYATAIALEELPEAFQFKFVDNDWHWLPVGEFYKNRTISAENTENFSYQKIINPELLTVFELINRDYICSEQAVLTADGERYLIGCDRYLASLTSSEFLGSRVEGHQTRFAVFAPRAHAVEVLYKSTLNAKWNVVPMQRTSSGIWSTIVEENLIGQYYLYRVTRSEGTQLVVDPYAQALVRRDGPGIVVVTNPVNSHYTPPQRENLVIYECHVRDMIANVPSLTDRLHFSGFQQFVESGYFESLGINALELQPVQEFDNETPDEYHWGYMPVNYFSPASAYASCPERASQINDFQKLVATCHQHGLSVILDVVYNHVGDPNHLHALDDRYYFRCRESGELENFSGCGNDLKTENPMVRRLILDSLIHWIQVYDVDGFRFDLAELVGLPFLEEARKKLQKLKPNLVMIAEPWSFRRYVGHELKTTQLQAWNDEFRNFIPQYVQGRGNREGLRYFLRGSVDFRSSFPAQSINYLASHDDYCWVDSITENAYHDGSQPTLNDLRRTHMALVILLLSQGIPMLAEGLEQLHSKKGVSNTYQRGDLNALSYMRQNEYPLTFQYTKNLIQLRQTSGLFASQESLPADYVKIFPSKRNNAAAVVLLQRDGAKSILLALNPYFENAEFELSLNKSFHQVADTFTFCGNCAHYPISSTSLEVPPMSCGIWVED